MTSTVRVKDRVLFVCNAVACAPDDSLGVGSVVVGSDVLYLTRMVLVHALNLILPDVAYVKASYL